MKISSNLHLFPKQHFPVSTEETSKLYDLMISKGDIDPPKTLKRPDHRFYEELDFPGFLVSKIIPNTLYDATNMAIGEWYYSRYKNWFEDFLWQVFQLSKRELGRRVGQIPCDKIMDEKPGAYFFLAQLDAYRDLKDSCLRTNVHKIFARGHIAPLLFLLNYADCFFETKCTETGDKRSDLYNWDISLGHKLGSDEQSFRVQLLRISYSILQTKATETTIQAWNERALRFKKQLHH